MPNVRYNSGRYYEYKTMTWLKERGYQCIRSAGSKGPIDVVGYNEEMILFVQVKKSSKPRGPTRQEWEKLSRVSVPPNVSVNFHIWVMGRSDPLEYPIFEA
jgi:hypothetical protein